MATLFRDDRIGRTRGTNSLDDQALTRVIDLGYEVDRRFVIDVSCASERFADQIARLER